MCLFHELCRHIQSHGLVYHLRVRLNLWKYQEEVIKYALNVIVAC